MRVLAILAGLFVLCTQEPSAQQLSSGVSVEDLMDNGHWKRARALVEARLHASPNDAFAVYLESKVQASFGHLDKALETAERAVSLQNHDPDCLAQLAEMHARLADRVSVLKQLSYVRQLKKEVETSLAVNPRHVDTLLVNIMFLFRAPMVAGGDKKRARNLAGELTRIDPGWGYLVQARMAELEKDDAKSEAVLTKAIAARPALYQARYYLAKFYCCVSAHHRLDDAERVARELIKVNPGESGGYEILARTLVQLQRWPELEAVLVEAEAKVPDDLSPYYFAANVLADQGKDFERAERYLKRYLSQEPEGRQPTIAQARDLLAFVTGKSPRKSVEAGL